MKEAKIRFVEAQGKFFPERLADTEEGYIKRLDIWNSEIDARVTFLWEIFSEEFFHRFGIIPHPYTQELFLVTPGCIGDHAILGKTFLESGHISLPKDLLYPSYRSILPHVLAHEMAHFYSHRRYLEILGDGNSSARPVQFGLVIGRDLQSNTFVYCNEALMEMTAAEILTACAPKIPEIANQTHIAPFAYSAERRMFLLFLQNLERGGYPQEDIFKWFQTIAWGDKKAAKQARADIRTLGNLAYPGGWNGPFANNKFPVYDRWV